MPYDSQGKYIMTPEEITEHRERHKDYKSANETTFFTPPSETTKAQARETTDEARARFLIGPNSNAIAANKLAISNPDEYRRLHDLAVRLRIIGG
jgi:hypothetical protein